MSSAVNQWNLIHKFKTFTASKSCMGLLFIPEDFFIFLLFEDGLTIGLVGKVLVNCHFSRCWFYRNFLPSFDDTKTSSISNVEN